ncbi:MAG TPA: hypothetical protein VFZ91_09410 [Allosphingosinicella sp.]
MGKTISELGEDLFTLLSAIVNGGDEKVPSDPNTFISWCMPGLPFEAADFGFCAKGFGGGATAEEEKSLMQQAYALATWVDFIPDASAAYTGDHQDRVWRTSQARLSHMYGEILRQCRVADNPLSEAELAQLERLRGLLRATRKNLVTGAEVLIDSPVMEAYNQYMADYIAARTEYNNKRIAAASAQGPEGKAAVADFFLNGTLYQMKAANALRRWEALGFKNDVEEIFATINNLTGRSAAVWRQKLLDAYEESKVSGLGPGQDFFYTTLLPGNFATSKGWQEYKHTEEHTTEKVRSTETSWKASAGLKWKLQAKASAGGSTKKESEDLRTEKFAISFEFTQVVIARPFFFPEFFMNRGWTLEKGKGWMFDEFPSDGGSPPKGLFVAYPTTLLMARNIVIESEEIARHAETFKKDFKAGGNLSLGLFSLSGEYGKSESGRDYQLDIQGNRIVVPGMQIIGSVNRLCGKSPNPFPGLFDEAAEPVAEPAPVPVA